MTAKDLISISLMIQLPWWGRATISILPWVMALPGGWRLPPAAVWLIDRILTSTRVVYVKDVAARPVYPWPEHPCLACGKGCPVFAQICYECEKAGWP